MYHCVHSSVYCIAKAFYSTASLLSNTALTLNVIQYLHGNRLSPYSLNVGLPLPRRFNKVHTSDDLWVSTTYCYIIDTLRLRLLESVFKCFQTIGGLLKSSLRCVRLLEETLKNILKHSRRLEQLTLGYVERVGVCEDYLGNHLLNWEHAEAMLTSRVFGNLSQANFWTEE